MPRTRRRVARALCHPLRATLSKRINAAARPLPLEDLARALDLAVGHARYHVRVLAACGLAKIDDDDCTQPA